MKTMVNFLFGSVFVLIISLAVFLPLSLLRLSSTATSNLVLGEATSSQQIQVSQVSVVENSVVTVSALAYPNQKTYYHKIFKVRNNTFSPQSYKVEILSVSPDDADLSAQVYFESSDQRSELSLLAGGEKEVSLLLTLYPVSSTGTSTASRSYTLQIVLLSIN